MKIKDRGYSELHQVKIQEGDTLEPDDGYVFVDFEIELHDGEGDNLPPSIDEEPEIDTPPVWGETGGQYDFISFDSCDIVNYQGYNYIPIIIDNVKLKEVFPLGKQIRAFTLNAVEQDYLSNASVSTLIINEQGKRDFTVALSDGDVSNMQIALGNTHAKQTIWEKAINYKLGEVDNPLYTIWIDVFKGSTGLQGVVSFDLAVDVTLKEERVGDKNLNWIEKINSIKVYNPTKIEIDPSKADWENMAIRVGGYGHIGSPQ